MNIPETLKQRGKLYGDFRDHAHITQNLKIVMQHTAQWEALPSMHREALEMIAHKIGRILNGDPNYPNSWHDITGYAQLVEQRVAPPSAKQLDDDVVQHRARTRAMSGN